MLKLEKEKQNENPIVESNALCAHIGYGIWPRACILLTKARNVIAEAINNYCFSDTYGHIQVAGSEYCLATTHQDSKSVSWQSTAGCILQLE
eukprot:scaffold418191_cov17-Prasinocladus_malaysianus.AAC.1